jgi:hypothetical protein
LEKWPAYLKSTVSNMLNDSAAQILYWGPGLRVVAYNDKYIPHKGTKVTSIL